jgi:aldehyde dehydrogenase (NAD+)
MPVICFETISELWWDARKRRKMATVAEIFETMEYGPAPESTAPAYEWIARHEATFGLFIDGTWRNSAAGETFETSDPATGKSLAVVAQAGAQDVNAAVEAARSAQPAWWNLGAHGRARSLYALARQVQKHARLFAVLEALDNGKPIRETRDIDIPLVARHFYHHAGWAQLMPTELPDYEPLGVVGQIIPWNFPLLMLAWKIAPALAMGNTVVLKPAEYTPLTALLFAEICAEIGLPAGVVNILTGDGTTGALLTQHPGIDKIAFTGSTEVGRLIRQATAGSGKKLSLELGGKSPFLIFDDADLDAAVEGLVDAIWFNQGQVCCAGSRLLVQENIADRVYRKVRARMDTLRVGSPLDKTTDIGAIIAPVQLDRIKSLVQQGQAEGATLWQSANLCPATGCFFPPTLFTDVAPSSVLAQEEIFGPVLVSMTFRTPAEAVELANNTRYGLAASVWTENIGLALDIAPKLKAGTVWINSTNLFDAASGFGGYRESGYGREGGREGLWEYVKRSERPKNGASSVPSPKPAVTTVSPTTNALPPIDRTPKLYIGGKQARPDSGYSIPVLDPQGTVIGHVGEGSRKDIRNAVEAARGAGGWTKSNGHVRAQILYYLAENLAYRSTEFAARIAQMTGQSHDEATREVELSLERCYFYAAWADKFDGAVHQTAGRNVTLAMNEPLGVIGIACPTENPLLGLLSLVLPAIAMGNATVVIPSERYPLAATDLYQVLETSDIPAGVVNIITGKRDPLAEVLALHDEVSSVWYVGTPEGSKRVEYASAGNLKRTWVTDETRCDWNDPVIGQGTEFLRQATQVKNIWIPYTDEVSW